MYVKWVSSIVNLKQLESIRVRKSKVGSKSGALRPYIIGDLLVLS